MAKAFFISVLYLFNACFAQNFPPFKSLRYDEDYSFLKNDSSRDWYRKMKFSPLSAGMKTYISWGGEMRFQYFYSYNEGWGDEAKDNDGYVLSRFLGHADLHAGRHFRTFVQLQGSLAGSRVPASAVDDNPLELHQAFVDIKTSSSEKLKFIFRLGRQELMYGSQRIISVRDGPNNRQSFDAIKVTVNAGHDKLDLLYGNYIVARKNIFNDGYNNDNKLWGAYLAMNKVPVGSNIDLYYLGLWKKHTSFDDGNGREMRHSIGTRIWKGYGAWTYDAEVLYQFGSFDDKDICAWTASINSSYKFDLIKLKPEIGLKAELISGDKEYDDSKLQTFNPLFPRGAYFGLAALIGPANLIDLHPSLSLNLSDKLKFDIDYDIFWRYSRNDGIYAVNVTLIYPGRNRREKHIGRQLSGTLLYTPNNFIYFRYELTWFDTGDYLKKAGAGKDILFTGITAHLKF